MCIAVLMLTCSAVLILTFLLDTIEWMNGQLPDLNVPVDSSLEELRYILQDGIALCHLLNRLSPGAVKMVGQLHCIPFFVMLFFSVILRAGWICRQFLFVRIYCLPFFLTQSSASA